MESAIPVYRQKGQNHEFEVIRPLALQTNTEPQENYMKKVVKTLFHKSVDHNQPHVKSPGKMSMWNRVDNVF